MTYICLKQEPFTFEDYHIQSIREEDIYPIREWRNQQLHILRQKAPLTLEEQKKYFHHQVEPSFKENNPRNILVSFFKDEQLIGYGGLVHINWIDLRGEVSFLLDTKRTYDIALHQKEFAIFLKLIKKMAFEDLGLRRLTTEVFDVRPYHIEVLEQEGFRLEGRLKEHVLVNGRFVDSVLHGFLQKNYRP